LPGEVLMTADEAAIMETWPAALLLRQDDSKIHYM
jgi:hypothetical protein